MSKVMTGHVAGEQVFNTGVERRGADNAFAGVVSVALRPSYFDAFYRELLGGNDSTPMIMSLVRTDGAILAHYPRSPREPAAMAPDSPFAEAVAQGRRAGVVRMRSNVDGDNLIVAFRHVGSYPVYVLVRLSHVGDLGRVVSAPERADRCRCSCRRSCCGA